MIRTIDWTYIIYKIKFNSKPIGIEPILDRSDSNSVRFYDSIRTPVSFKRYQAVLNLRKQTKLAYGDSNVGMLLPFNEEIGVILASDF